MRIAIIGAGAIGCYLAAKLAAAGETVMLVARGAALAAIRRDGLRVTGAQAITARPAVIDAAAIGGQAPADLVMTCVKAYAAADVAPLAAALAGERGVWLPVLNGLPWWYRTRDGHALDAVDPGERIAGVLGRERVIGSAAYLRSESRGPGVVDYNGGKGLVIGGAGGIAAGMLERVAGVLTRAGVATTVTADVRSAVWSKLYGNISLNPLSAITGLTVTGMLADARLRGRLLAAVRETQAIAEAEGAVVDMTAEARVAGMAVLGAFRTSMLQDLDAGRPLEIGAILAAPLEVARRHAIAAPELTRLHDQVRRVGA